MTITIIGLGPGDAQQLTRQAWQILDEAEEVYLRTRQHPTVSELPAHLKLHSFDEVYEQAENFEQVYDTIAHQVLRLGQRPGGVIYAVPGHPLVGESSVTRILHLAEQEQAGPVRIVGAPSFIDPILAALRLDAMAGLQIADAVEIANACHPPLNPDVPAIVGQVYSRQVAAALKLSLMNQYPDEHVVILLHALSTPEERVEALPLHELDQRDLSHLTALYLPPLPPVSSLEAFQDTIARLRAPDGCPWDREQTHQTLRRNLLEESYEVLHALDADDANGLCEELGDLLLQIVLHSQIARESGEFSLAQVINHVDAKIKRRHPHVFGDPNNAGQRLQVSGVQDVLDNWESIKRSERQDAHHDELEARRSALAGVPLTLPALAQAEAYGHRAARLGFDWPDLSGVLDKLDEELDEIRQAGDPAARAAEFGDLLFTLANVARWLEIDPEAALRQANLRFAQRFQHVEEQAYAQGRQLSDISSDELDKIWQTAKEVVASQS
jgi:tetrapyrrole methylase family protein/MazG family protein